MHILAIPFKVKPRSRKLGIMVARAQFCSLDLEPILAKEPGNNEAVTTKQ